MVNGMVIISVYKERVVSVDINLSNTPRINFCKNYLMCIFFFSEITYFKVLGNSARKMEKVVRISSDKEEGWKHTLTLLLFFENS